MQSRSSTGSTCHQIALASVSARKRRRGGRRTMVSLAVADFAR